MPSSQHQPPFAHALLAGGAAGTTVDLSLFPLDTLKTRLQSEAGFVASGGFRGVYRGVGSAVVGSAPGAAFFFCTYEGVKSLLLSSPASASTSTSTSTTTTTTPTTSPTVAHMAAASLGEVAACAVRVPTEVVKQRAQAGQHGGSSAAALRAILSLRSETGRGLPAVFRELYRGWGITVLREVPFTVIQFPLWEALKGWGRSRRASSGGVGEGDVGAIESALYGSVSGGIAAALTTPLDVLKTRVMLSTRGRESVLTVLRDIWTANRSLRPFFAGVGPRVTWISIGGAIFLGSYQSVVNVLHGHSVL